MPSSIIAQDILNIGTPLVMEAKAPNSHHVTIFEDDGETGYLYAVDPENPNSPVQDALHIYNVESVTDRGASSTIQIVWTNNGKQSLLLINRYPHAAFDFEKQRGYCRSSFPLPSGAWSKDGHQWEDNILEHFK
jgi:hypothetical protein